MPKNDGEELAQLHPPLSPGSPATVHNVWTTQSCITLDQLISLSVTMCHQTKLLPTATLMPIGLKPASLSHILFSVLNCVWKLPFIDFSKSLI